MDMKELKSSEAPPINPPSMSCFENNAAAFSGLQLPPYSKRYFLRLKHQNVEQFSNMMMHKLTSSGLAVEPVPIAQTGS